MRAPRLFLILATLCALACSATPARAALAATTDPVELQIFLVTMGQGDEVWEKFGHNAIWIHDQAQGTDWVYNYGVFDFNSPGYWGRFVKGDWIYQLAVADIYQTLRAYRYYDRTVTAQELDLTPAEARELQTFLEWNARPENSEYLYDYFRDNCSTRVRDVLDQVLGGALYQATADVPTNTTYRWHSHRLVQGDVATYSGLSLAMGPASDRPISRWEEMFLPMKLQERVRELQVADSAGNLRPLVKTEQVLYEATQRAPEPLIVAPVMGRYLLVGCALGALLLLLAWGGAGQGWWRGAARAGFALVAGGWALLSGGFGVLLAALWSMTNHSISYYNENLLQVTPLVLPLALLLPALVFGARWARRPALWLSGAVALSSGIGLLAQLLPWFDQANGDIIALALPSNLALAAAVRLHLRRALYSPPAGTSSGSRESHRSTSAGR